MKSLDCVASNDGGVKEYYILACEISVFLTVNRIRKSQTSDEEMHPKSSTVFVVRERI